MSQPIMRGPKGQAWIQMYVDDNYLYRRVERRNMTPYFFKNEWLILSPDFVSIETKKRMYIGKPYCPKNDTETDIVNHVNKKGWLVKNLKLETGEYEWNQICVVNKEKKIIARMSYPCKFGIKALKQAIYSPFTPKIAKGDREKYERKNLK